MNVIIRFQKSIEASFRRTKFLTGMTILLCSLVAVVSVFASYSFAREQKAQIYVLDKGQSFLALQSDGMATKDLEIIDHVTRFHELFFNMAPNANAIIQNVNRALVLSDKSVYDYYSDLSEQGFYARLVQANITQQEIAMKWKTRLSEMREKSSGRLADAVNWKVVLVIGIAISLILCLSHVYSFMKLMNL